MPEPFTPPSIVVGVDGSRGAVRAALWAIDEAVSRDIPLRLVYAIEPSGSDTVDPQEEARQLASAELAVRYAANAVEATERPVKVEIEILQGRPIATLVEASRAAAMICVGAVGLKHFDHNRIGSTATALVGSAHCPVVIVRGSDGATAHDSGWVVVELDESPDSAAVLQFGVQEARLRDAPLRVLSSWQSRYTDVHDSHAVSDGNRMVRAQLDRRLSHWKHQLPRSRRAPGRHPRQRAELSGQARRGDPAGRGGCAQRGGHRGTAGPDGVGGPAQHRLLGIGGRSSAPVVTTIS